MHQEEFRFIKIMNFSNYVEHERKMSWIVQTLRVAEASSEMHLQTLNPWATLMLHSLFVSFFMCSSFFIYFSIYVATAPLFETDTECVAAFFVGTFYCYGSRLSDAQIKFDMFVRKHVRRGKKDSFSSATGTCPPKSQLPIVVNLHFQSRELL